MPQGMSRAARRPAIPVISVTGRSASRSASASTSSTASAPNGLAASEISLARVRVRAIPTVTGTRTRSQDPVADRLGQLLERLPARREREEEELVDRIILDPGRQVAHDLEHQPAQDLVPVEVALDVDPHRALHQRVPDRHPGPHPRRLHLIALGDDAGPLVAQHPHRLPAQERVAHPLRRDVEAIRVEMPHRRLGSPHGRKCSMYVRSGQGKCPLLRRDASVVDASPRFSPTSTHIALVGGGRRLAPGVLGSTAARLRPWTSTHGLRVSSGHSEVSRVSDSLDARRRSDLHPLCDDNASRVH